MHDLPEDGYILLRIFLTSLFVSLSLQSNNVNIEDIFQPRVSFSPVSASNVNRLLLTYRVKHKTKT
jgi:hypothetical protein